jgi:hypothetical protein
VSAMDITIAPFAGHLGSLASSVLATVRPLPSRKLNRLGCARRTEVIRNG